MATPTQLIFRESPGSLPATYQIPPSLELVVSSVFARFNGTAAAGSFVPCLDLLSQDDKLISRVAVAQTLAVGDLARVTWAPFLRKQATSSTPTTGIDGFGGGELVTNSIAVPAATVTNILTGPANTLTRVTDFGGGHCCSFPGATPFLQVRRDGQWGFMLQVHWLTAGAYDRYIEIVLPGASVWGQPSGLATARTAGTIAEDEWQAIHLDAIAFGLAASFPAGIQANAWQNSGAGVNIKLDLQFVHGWWYGTEAP